MNRRHHWQGSFSLKSLTVLRLRRSRLTLRFIHSFGQTLNLAIDWCRDFFRHVFVAPAKTSSYATVVVVVYLNVFVVFNFFNQVYVDLLGEPVLRFDLVENRSDFLVVQVYLGKSLGLVWGILLNWHRIFRCSGLESPVELDPFSLVQFMPTHRCFSMQLLLICLM